VEEMDDIDPTAIAMQTDPVTRRMKGVTFHGNMYFDVPFMTEVAENLWQGGCEDGLLLPEFIAHLVSLYPWESYQVKHELRSRLIVGMYDDRDQGTEEVEAIAAWVNVCRKSGPVLVHCQAGLNRSSLVTVRALCQEGMSPDGAIALLREKRSYACLCNTAFEEWLRGEQDG
jgi:protein-tyrosine phosphatase